METADDRLSSLPDSILSNILSLLPLKVAVSTSVLSRRWRRRWTTITDLRIDYSPRTLDEVHFGMSEFFTIVDDVVRQLTSPYFGEFEISVDTDSLDFDYAYENSNYRRRYWEECCCQVVSLISQLGHRVVKSMRIYLDCDFLRPWIPPCVFRMRSLVALDLRYRFYCKLPKEVVLPCLKKLHIGLYYHSRDFIQRLLSCCPLLEDLDIMVSDSDDLHYRMQEGIPTEINDSVVISLPKLKRLNLGFIGKEAKVMIDAPNLEYFEIYETRLSMYCFAKIPTLLNRVLIDVDLMPEDIPKYKNHVSGLVPMISSARSMRLSFGLAEAFRYVYTDGILPRFHNLVNLDIADVESLKMLLDFLQSSPSLEFLLVRNYSHGDGEYLEEAMSCTLDFVPLCLSTNLKTIIIRGTKGNENDLKLIKYILTNATVLEFLEVSVSSSFEQKEAAICKELELCEELFTCFRSSPTCEIEFIGEHLKVSGEGIKIGKLECRDLCWYMH